jgi:glutamyl-tRNA synthetase
LCPEPKIILLNLFPGAELNLTKACSVGGPFAPYRQSERKEIYQQYAMKLLETGHAYYAFDTPEELEALRKKAELKILHFNMM